MRMPSDFNRGMASGDGASIQFTWPDSSAAVRVDASGIGISTRRSCFGTRVLSQYSVFGTNSRRWCATVLSNLYGPVPEGCSAYSVQLLLTSLARHGLIIST